MCVRVVCAAYVGVFCMMCVSIECGVCAVCVICVCGVVCVVSGVCGKCCQQLVWSDVCVCVCVFGLLCMSWHLCVHIMCVWCRG